MATTHARRVKKFVIRALTFWVQAAGPIRQPAAGLYISDGTNSRFCMWVPHGALAGEWALEHEAEEKITVYSSMFIQNGHLVPTTPSTHYHVLHPITIDEFVPEAGHSFNGTQLTIEQQTEHGFSVRFTIRYKKHANQKLEKWQHHFEVKYPGKAPRDMIHKSFWGSLASNGDRPVLGYGPSPFLIDI
jgi:hypothetical protein